MGKNPIGYVINVPIFIKMEKMYTPYTKFIIMADAQKRCGVSYRQHGVEAF